MIYEKVEKDKVMLKKICLLYPLRENIYWREENAPDRSCHNGTPLKIEKNWQDGFEAPR